MGGLGFGAACLRQFSTLAAGQLGLRSGGGDGALCRLADRQRHPDQGTCLGEQDRGMHGDPNQHAVSVGENGKRGE